MIWSSHSDFSDACASVQPHPFSAGRQSGRATSSKVSRDRGEHGQRGAKQEGQHPNDRGFYYFFGFAQKYRPERLFRNREKTPAVGWRADQNSDEAIAFLNRSHQGQKSFFLHVAYNEPHGPTERPPQVYIDHFKSGSDTVAVHFGTDQGIVRILEALKRTGRMDNTLIVFT